MWMGSVDEDRRDICVVICVVTVCGVDVGRRTW